MTTNAENVLVAQYGEIYAAPLGTVLPTDASTAPIAAFVSVGGISEEGVTITPARDVADVKDWSGASVRDLQTSSAVEFAFRMLESTDAVRALIGFDSATGFTGDQLPSKAWVVDWHDGDTTARYCIASSRIVSTDAIPHNAKELVSYGVKLSPKRVAGKYFHPYYDDGVS